MYISARGSKINEVEEKICIEKRREEKVKFVSVASRSRKEKVTRESHVKFISGQLARIGDAAIAEKETVNM